MFTLMQQTVDSVVGCDYSWRQVRLSDVVEEVVHTTALSMLLGSKLGHDNGFGIALKRFSISFGVAAVVIGLTPGPLKQIVAWPARTIVDFFRRRAYNYLTPLIHERFKVEERRRGDPDLDSRGPQDFITSVVRAILDDEKGTMEHFREIETLFTIIIMTLVTTTSLTLTNTLLDLLSSDPSLEYYQALRKEADSAFTSLDWSNVASPPKLDCIDSAIRESLRLHPTHTRGLFRTVVAEEGLTLPDKHHIPQGCMMSIPVYWIHRDERFYKDPNTYIPFRFLLTDASDQRKPRGLVDTSDTFLSFSHGVYSCDGRFFAAQLMKMFLAYITMHYDVKPLDTRPPNVLLSDFCIPPRSVKLWIRRRNPETYLHLRP
ncbi:cytochrome P450 [Aspergillus alliaceus]|uniref:Cytochrome P450 n=1 Tax=Petromyces alliaceus TaxID=209559 RepID=A0A5N7CQL5_PETAA|nr:cytochrome P450 [Aspergillus alliaceus]